MEHPQREAPDVGIRDEEDLEEHLSRPTAGVMQALERTDGDILVLGVSGKMGPSLARMARRACDRLGQTGRRVIGAARFTDPAAEAGLRRHGVETLRCDLLGRADVATLPETPNLVYMAGRKFGTRQTPELTWAMNALAPALVAERFPSSRTVVFSTGCVYPPVPVTSGGSREDDPTVPDGEYAYSCIAREQVFRHYAARQGTPLALFRLNYAIDLRYGVLLDVARKVWDDQPVDLTTGNVNVIWQGDANAMALQCLEQAQSPPFVVNVTGPETISVRALAAEFGERFGRPARFAGQEADTALLSNAGRAHGLFGYPSVPLGRMVEWVADWVRRGGAVLDRPTHYEVRDGKF